MTAGPDVPAPADDDLETVEDLSRAVPDAVHTLERARYSFDHADLAGHVLRARSGSGSGSASAPRRDSSRVSV